MQSLMSYFVNHVRGSVRVRAFPWRPFTLGLDNQFINHNHHQYFYRSVGSFAVMGFSY